MCIIRSVSDLAYIQRSTPCVKQTWHLEVYMYKIEVHKDPQRYGLPFLFKWFFVTIEIRWISRNLLTYLVGLPTALFERLGKSEESVLNQLILNFSGWFYMKSTYFHMKFVCFHEICLISHEIHLFFFKSIWMKSVGFNKKQENEV